MKPTPTILPAGTRLHALDSLRGLVIVIMVLDHVRDYFHETGWAYDALDPKFTTLALYLTRWLTHFCAPTFVFLAGVSIWLQSIKGKGAPQLSKFLVLRGLWIIGLELTVISFGWSFSIPYLFLLQVMWAIGFAMLAMAGLVRLSQRTVLVIGIAIVAGHNLLDPIVPQQFGGFSLVWTFLHEGGLIHIGTSPVFNFAYPILPWVGVMALGFGLGPIFLSPDGGRAIRKLGIAMVAAFLLLRGLNVYGDPNPYFDAMSFFNVLKYPPSLLYICATLGPVFVFYPLLERGSGPIAGFFRTFGSVPMMAYIAHIYVLHLLAVAIHFAAGHNIMGMFNYLYYAFLQPDVFNGISFPLYVTYLVWLTVIALIYPLCRWWAALKRRRRDWWLSYL